MPEMTTPTHEKCRPIIFNRAFLNKDLIKAMEGKTKVKLLKDLMPFSKDIKQGSIGYVDGYIKRDRELYAVVIFPKNISSHINMVNVDMLEVIE